ncbi:hypothetical protein HYV74_02270, partial [Candidatus Uhrbacteria bacterium]|nr:hypothetical protein [Candidatus Uhrbacteria bacterium]
MSMTHEENLQFWCLLLLTRHIRLGTLTLDMLHERLPSDGTTNPQARWYHTLPDWMESNIRDLAAVIIERAAPDTPWDHARATRLLERLSAKLAVGDLPPEVIARILRQPLTT